MAIKIVDIAASCIVDIDVILNSKFDIVVVVAATFIHACIVVLRVQVVSHGHHVVIWLSVEVFYNVLITVQIGLFGLLAQTATASGALGAFVV